MLKSRVVIYREEDGSPPFVDGFEKLPGHAQDKVVVRMERLREPGHELRRPEADFLRDGILGQNLQNRKMTNPPEGGRKDLDSFFVGSGGATFVAMMQSTDLRNRYDPSSVWRLNGSGLRAVFLQCKVRAAAVVIFREASDVVVQTALVEDNHVIEAFAANRADDPFDIGALPR